MKKDKNKAPATKPSRKRATKSGTSRSLMAIGAHADDIEFWAGGTCLKYHRAGYDIVYVMSTNNMSGGLHFVATGGIVVTKKCTPETMMPIRKSECDKAAAVVGTTPIHLDHPQRHYTAPDLSRVDEGYGVPPPSGIALKGPSIMMAHDDPQSVRRVADLILEHNPEAVLTHSQVTGSPEHYGTAMLVMKGYLLARAEGYRGWILFWNEMSQDTELRDTFRTWNTFVDITGLRKAKEDWIRCHISMVPFPERMDYLDFSEECGCQLAETFTIGKFGEEPQAIGEFIEEILRNRCQP